MVSFLHPLGLSTLLNDLSDFELPLDEVILEAMTMVSIQWEDLHHGLCFLPFLGDFPS
jgi:hypothetical protein